MVEIGLGWSVLPETLVRELHVMPFEEVSIERELGYIHHMKRSLSNAAVGFLELMTL
jgi:DNA-binding transcriptional LysR family regulator